MVIDWTFRSVPGLQSYYAGGVIVMNYTGFIVVALEDAPFIGGQRNVGAAKAAAGGLK